MNKKAWISSIVTVFTLLGNGHAAAPDKKPLDDYRMVIVEPFDSAVKGAVGLPGAVRDACVQVMKEDGLFSQILTTEEAKAAHETDAESTPGVLRLSGHLVDFDPGNAAKRLMVGLGSGRAHAGFDFVLTDPVTSKVVWQKRLKQTASFWFNGSTSSASERSELPEGLAKKLLDELKKEQSK